MRLLKGAVVGVDVLDGVSVMVRVADRVIVREGVCVGAPTTVLVAVAKKFVVPLGHLVP